MNNTSRDSLALWKIINEEDAVLSPKNRGENFSSGFLHSEFFGGGVSRYAATPLIVALFPGHSDIAEFRLWSPIATGNHLDRNEKIPDMLPFSLCNKKRPAIRHMNLSFQRHYRFHPATSGGRSG